MNRWLFLLIALITTALLLSKNSSAYAKQEQAVFSGWSKVTDQPSPGRCIHPDRLKICWDRTAIMQVETNDARFTGEDDLVFDSIYTRTPHSGRVKGDFLLTQAGGSWEGTWNGTTEAQGDTLFMGQGRGHGDYEGLVIHWLMKRSGSNWRVIMTAIGSISNASLLTRKR